jgi:hypothetical protein
MEPNQPLSVTLKSIAVKADKMDLQETTDNQAISGSNEYIFNKNFFVDRSFHSTFDGYYDEEDLFHTPEGSFFNLNREYFNRFGYDKYGGRYDDMGVYIPGEGWDSDFQCYKEDLDEDFLTQQVEQIESIFEDQIQLDNNLCNLSMNSDETAEEEKAEENEPADFLKVKDAMEAELRMQAQSTQKSVLNGKANLALLYYKNEIMLDVGTKSAVKNGVSENFSGEVNKCVNDSVSKIVNNQLINASHVKASPVKAQNIIVNVENNNYFGFSNANNGSNSQVCLDNNYNDIGNAESANVNLSEIVHSGNVKAENTINVRLTPVKGNYVHEPTPFKIQASEIRQEKNI